MLVLLEPVSSQVVSGEFVQYHVYWGGSLLAQSVKSLPTVHTAPGFDPWVGKSPWRRRGQPTPVFLPGESHGQRSLAGCICGVGEVGHD